MLKVVFFSASLKGTVFSNIILRRLLRRISMMLRAKSFAGLIILLLFTLILCGVNLSCAAAPSSSGDAAACEQALFDAVNVLRQSNGKAPLSRNAYIDGLCRQYAQYMVSQDVLSHDNMNSRCSSIYTNISGMHACEENLIGSNHLPCDASHIEQMWFTSPEHKTNMINAAYTISGMGIVIDRRGRIWVCQMFAGP
jgi:uncharacterized protein YkwD